MCIYITGIDIIYIYTHIIDIGIIYVYIYIL